MEETDTITAEVTYIEDMLALPEQESIICHPKGVKKCLTIDLTNRNTTIYFGPEMKPAGPGSVLDDVTYTTELISETGLRPVPITIAFIRGLFAASCMPSRNGIRYWDDA